MSDKKKPGISKMGESAVNFGILQRTEPGAEKTPPLAVPPEQQHDKGGGSPAATLPPAAGKVTKPAVVAKAAGPSEKKTGSVPSSASLKAQGHQGSKGKNKNIEQANPYGYDLEPAWPLVGYEKPFLIQIPENQGRAAAALSIRIPLDLNQTVERHCAKLGVKNLSEWVREAMARQLALEQQYLAKKG